MTRRTRALALVSLAFAMSACTAIAGLTDDYKLAGAGSTREGGSGDGDVDKDGALSDGFVPGTDGGADAKDDQLVADGGTFCEQHAGEANVAFCDDFELPTSGPMWGWDGYTTTAAVLTRLNGIGAGGSNAIRATVTSAPAAGGSSAYLQKQVGTTDGFNAFATQQLSFSFSISKKATLYGATLGALGHSASLKYVGASVYTAAGEDGIDVSDPPGSLSSPYLPSAVGDWHRATITMTRTATGVYSSTVEVTKVGTTGTTTVVDSARPGFTGSASPSLILIGAFFTSNDLGGVEVVIDDVLIKQTK